MILSSDDERAWAMGYAIHRCVVACGGHAYHSADGAVRFVNVDGDTGRVGLFFPAWLIEAMKENKLKIKRYFEIEKLRDAVVEAIKKSGAKKKY